MNRETENGQPQINNAFHDGAIRVFGGCVQIGGVQNIYGADGDEKRRLTDEQVAAALTAINGRGKAVSEQQAWLGVIKRLQQYGWPHDLEKCVERLNALPGMDGLEYPCKYESFRKFKNYGFARLEVAEWADYKPNETERAIFYKCRDAADATEAEIRRIVGGE